MQARYVGSAGNRLLRILAAAIGRPTVLRAVGGAVAANPISLIIPCHQVIGKDGSLVGYGGGLPLKERLLSLEKGSLDL